MKPVSDTLLSSIGHPSGATPEGSRFGAFQPDRDAVNRPFRNRLPR